MGGRGGCGSRVSLLGFALWLASAHASADPKPWNIGSKQAQQPEASEVEEQPERLRGAALHARLPQLKLRAEPRVVQGAVGFGVRMLYVPLGLQGTLDVYPVRWLRFGLIYGAGMSFSDNRKLAFAQYGEGQVGVRLFGGASEADAELQLRRSVGGYGEALPSWLRRATGSDAETIPVWLPSSHALFVEGGAFTGYMALKHCVASCAYDPLMPALEPEMVAVSHQLVLPFAGIRYVYYSEATMAAPVVNRVRYTQVFLHALLRPINEPEGEWTYLSGDHVARAALGMRMGWEFPVTPGCLANLLLRTGCLQGSFSLGYTPFPAFLLFQFHALLPIR
ncbi:MAG TPA: hypothetical protein VJN18_31800 [Polyangiaceae bacterium]|nr:hypothetical protein [Polyangiaceae bacterium]